MAEEADPWSNRFVTSNTSDSATHPTGRARIEPPDISEKGGLKDGRPQRSDRRLFMQLQAFGNCADSAAVASHLAGCADAVVVYEDINDPAGIAVLTVSEDPNVFLDQVRPRLAAGAMSGLTLKPQFTMFGRTYALGYEPDLREVLVERPLRTVANPEWRWGIWYPLRRSGSFAQLPAEEQRTILAEHGQIGMAFGAADYVHDVRLACHGERRHIEPARAKRADQSGRAVWRSAGDDQRVASQLACDRAGVVRCAGADDHARGRRELESHHQPASPGNTLANFADDRGSAIIGATASRHVA